MSTKQAINDKLQGSVATYLRCGRVANNQIKIRLLLSVGVEFFSKSVNIWQSYKQERALSCTFSVFYHRVGQAHNVHETITFLLVTLPNIYRFINFFHSHSAVNLS